MSEIPSGAEIDINHSQRAQRIVYKDPVLQEQRKRELHKIAQKKYNDKLARRLGRKKYKPRKSQGVKELEAKLEKTLATPHSSVVAEWREKYRGYSPNGDDEPTS